jgi:hypothetical protein
MDEKEFEQLWHQAEAEGYAKRLASEYPKWRTQRNRAMGMVAGLALVVAVSAPAWMPNNESKAAYAQVHCNKAGTSDQHWVDLADELLLS